MQTPLGFSRSGRPDRLRVGAVALALCLTGCVGLVGESATRSEGASGSGAPDDTGGAGSTGAPGSEPGGLDPLPPERASRLVYQCDETQKRMRGLTFDRMRRLSRQELINTMGSLLGDAAAADPLVRDKFAGLPSDDLVTANGFVETPPVALAQTLASAARQAVTLVMANPAWKTSNLGGCSTQATLTDTCVQQAVQKFGARVWRRDLDAAEVKSYTDFHKATGGGQDGLAFVLRRMLQAPSLVFHLEQGDGAPASDGRIRLTGFEVASRIAYLTAGTMPDEALMNAARGGALDGMEDVRQHGVRLLASPHGRDKVSDFLRYYARLGSVSDPLAVVAKRAGINQSAGLGAQMRDEGFAFLEHVFWTTRGTFADLMTSTAAFPRSDALARVFGIAVVPSGQVGNAPTHRGLLHRPGLLSAPTGRTSPIIRGAHVRKEFLCANLGLPDADAVEARKNEVEGMVGDTDRMSSRDRATVLTDSSTCRGCHNLINNIGFAFEGYDQLGAPRTEEAVFDQNGALLGTWPIDTRVDDPEIEEFGPTALASSAELTAALAESFTAKACLAQRLLEYYRAREIDSDTDGCSLREAELTTHQGSLQDAVMAALANDDIFWRKQP